MAAKFFTGLPLDGPDPECVKGFGEAALSAVSDSPPKPSLDHSHRGRKAKAVPVTIGWGPQQERSAPDRACDESPLAGFRPPAG
jgi:hypothetical protein